MWYCHIYFAIPIPMKSCFWSPCILFTRPSKTMASQKWVVLAILDTTNQILGCFCTMALLNEYAAHEFFQHPKVSYIIAHTSMEWEGHALAEATLFLVIWDAMIKSQDIRLKKFETELKHRWEKNPMLHQVWWPENKSCDSQVLPPKVFVDNSIRFSEGKVHSALSGEQVVLHTIAGQNYWGDCMYRFKLWGQLLWGDKKLPYYGEIDWRLLLPSSVYPKFPSWTYQVL